MRHILRPEQVVSMRLGKSQWGPIRCMLYRLWRCVTELVLLAAAVVCFLYAAKFVFAGS